MTNVEYQECVDDGLCSPPEQNSSWTRGSYYANPDYANNPVIWVSWYQAQEYCTWSGKRFPTEAEWEYAARGGLAGKRFPWGNEITCDDGNWGRNNYYSSTCRDHAGRDNDTHAVGRYPAKGYGLCDAAGNVYEWVNDWWSGPYYQYCFDNGIVNDPPGAESGSWRVFRGGGWCDETHYQRLATREGFEPDMAFDCVGFRCARGGAFGP